MWFLFALVFAVTSSVTVVVAKKIMERTDEYHYLFLNGLFTLPFLLALTVIFYQVPQVDKYFVVGVVIALIIDIIAAIAAYRAIKISDISLVNPISSFNPVFTTLIALVFLGEKISLLGAIGVLLVIVGAYFLQISQKRGDIFKPFRLLVSQEGVRLSMLAYFLWAITPIFQKMAIIHTNPSVPVFVSVVETVGIIAFFGFFLMQRKNQTFKFDGWLFKALLLAGFLSGVGQMCAFNAFSQGNLGYVTAVFKLSMIFTVILGGIFLQENISKRLLGALIMLAGTVLLVI